MRRTRQSVLRATWGSMLESGARWTVATVSEKRIATGSHCRYLQRREVSPEAIVAAKGMVMGLVLRGGNDDGLLPSTGESEL